MLKIFSHTYRINHWSHGFEILSRDYPFIKSGPYEGNLNRNKIDRMANDHLSTVAILKIYTNIAKYCLQFLAMPTSTTTDAMLPAQPLMLWSWIFYKANSSKDLWIGSKLTE